MAKKRQTSGGAKKNPTKYARWIRDAKANLRYYIKHGDRDGIERTREEIAQLKREQRRLLTDMRRHPEKYNPPRKGKTNRWIKAKAVRVVRNKGRMIVEVRR